jgi:hypothetical protein
MLSTEIETGKIGIREGAPGKDVRSGTFIPDSLSSRSSISR